MRKVSHKLRLNISTVCFIIGGILVLGTLFSGALTGNGVFVTGTLFGFIIIVIGIFFARKQKQNRIKNKDYSENSSITPILVKISGTIVLVVGFVIALWSLSVPMIIAGQYMIVGLIIVLLGGLTIYGGYRMKKGEKQRIVCSYCGYIAETERELHNHSLICERKKQEDQNSLK